jgi:predicted RNA-binding Zn ribbon-like protein
VQVHWVLVEGRKLPRKVAGHPALELCNTWAGWGGPPVPGQEWLHDYRTLALWAGHVELLDAECVARLCELGDREPDRAQAALEAARELRGALYTTFLDPRTTPGFPVVRRYAEHAAAALRLVPDGDGLAHWRLTADSGVITPVLAAAWSASQLLGDPRRFHVAACPGQYCGSLFLDPRGRRRWCTMSICGNRAKVNAYLQRRAPRAD